MARTVHQEFNPDAVAHFGISCDPYGVMVDSSGNFETVFIDESERLTKRLINILDKSDCDVQPDMTLYKRAFVLPNCPVSNDRIKSALKEHSITITKDLSKADIIVSHTDIDTSRENGVNINHNYMFNHLWNYSSIDTGNVLIDNYCNENAREGVKARVILDAKAEEWINRYNVMYHSMPYDSYLITGLAVNVAYEAEVNGIPVFDVQKVMHQSANKINITEQLMSDISSMVSSGGEDNWNMIGAILPTIDYKYKPHLIWQLSQDIGHSLYRIKRNKDVQYWRSASDFDLYYNMSALDMIQHMEKSNILNSESFKFLESIVRKEIRIDNRDLYVFKVNVKPEYKKYLK